MIKKIIDTNIREINLDTVIIYKDNSKYTIYYKDVFILYALLRFGFYRINNIFEMYIDKRYLNYVLKTLNTNHISYMIVDKINQYHIVKRSIFIDTKNYEKYYLKGRMLYKRRKQINKIIVILKNNYISKTKLKEIHYLLEGECHELT